MEAPLLMQCFYGIHFRKLQKTAKHEREGVPNRLKTGRPPGFSKRDKQKLKSACAALTEEEHKLLNECLQESLVERDKLSPDNVQVSFQTIRYWEKKLELRIVTLQMTTEAKVKACNDIRNAVSFCAMNHLKESVVPPGLKFNVDFNHFISTNADGTNTKAKVCEDTKGITLKGKPTPG